MGANDEFDKGNDAPVPPHERTWRHPAEVSNALRQEHALKAAPPPIGRRAAALVAFVSIVASATLMLVTVQKGVSDPVAEPVDASTTSLPSKTGTADGAVPVVHAYDDYYVVPSGEFAGNRLTAALPGGKRFEAEVVTTVPAKGISIVRHRAPTLRNLPYPTGQEIVTHLSTSFTAVDRTGQRLTATVGLSSHLSPAAVASQWNVGWFPLDIDGVINGVASLYVGEQLHGIAVRHQHTHFGISLDGLADLINDANDARNG